MGVSKRKDGHWRVSFRDDQGRSCSKIFPKGRAGKADAEAFDLEVKLAKARQQDLPSFARTSDAYIGQIAQDWFDEKKVQGRKIGWLRDWAHIFNTRFVPVLGRKPAGHITQADIMTVIGTHWADASQATRNRYIGYIKSILEYGVEQGHIEKNPLARWKKGKEARHESPLTLADLKAIQKNAPPHTAWALDVAWHVPCRPGNDLFGLKFSQVDHDRGGINVFHTKVSKWAWVRLPDDFLREVFARKLQHASGHLIEYQGSPIKDLGTSLSKAAQKAGLPYPVRMYDIRHLWITTALDASTEPSVVAKMAGTSVKMIVQNYYENHAAQDRCVENMPRLREQERKGKVVKI